MNFQFTVTPEMLSSIPSMDLAHFSNIINAELIRRGAQGSPGVPGFGGGYNNLPQITRNLLVDRYGLDGRKQLGQFGNDTGFWDQSPKYLLDDMPSRTAFDDTVSMFAYTPTKNIGDEFRKMVAAQLDYPLTALGDIELFFSPTLEHYSQVQARVQTEGEPIICLLTHPLKWVVEYIYGAVADEEAKRLPDIIPLRPVVFGEGAQLLQEFKEKSIVTELNLGGDAYQIAPVKINETINIAAASTLGALIKGDKIPQHSEPARHMEVRSVYVQVGNHLVRMMTNTLARASFCPSTQLGSSDMVVDLEATAVLRRGDTDAFGDPYDFMEFCCDDDTVTVTVKVSGFFSPQVGELIFTANPVVLGATGSNAASMIAKVLSDTSKVLAVEPLGDIRVY